MSYLLGARLGPRADATFMRALATEDVEPPTSEDHARIAQLVDGSPPLHHRPPGPSRGARFDVARR